MMKSVVMVLWVSAMALLTACGGGGSSSRSNGSDSSGGLGENTLILPSVPGLEMVTYILPHDLDRDGLEDLILFLAPPSYASQTRIVALINTGGAFELDEHYFPEALFAGGVRWIESATLVDVNNDGFADLVMHRDIGHSPRSLLLWDEDQGHFVLPEDPYNAFGMQEGFWPLTGFTVLDANGDGAPDLLGRDENRDWYLLENNGAGDFIRGEEVLFSHGAAPFFVYQPVVMDVDGDGRDDLIFGGPAFGAGWVDEKVPLIVMFNTASGWVKADNNEVFTGDAAAFTHLRLTGVADLNGDGHPDVVIANHGYDAGDLRGEYNGILFNSGQGGFRVDTTSAAVNYLGFTHALALGDLDNDGDIDIVFVDITGADVDYRGRIRVLYNDGHGQFTSREATLSHEFAMSTSGWTAAALSDVDGDGYLDLVLGGMGAQSASLVLLNDGLGYFR